MFEPLYLQCETQLCKSPDINNELPKIGAKNVVTVHVFFEKLNMSTND
jgi:hypothetical protein